MRSRTVPLLVLAVGCGLVAAFLVHRLAARPDPTNTLPVLVAAKDLPQGTMIDEKNIKDWIKIAHVHRDVIPANALKEEKDMLGKVVGRPLATNSLLTQHDFCDLESVLSKMEPGYLAITVRATLESSHVGFVLPGSRVDVICTTNPISDPRTTLSRIFLRNVKVLASNKHTDRPKDMSTVDNPVTVTLQVKPDEAERVNWVSSKGIVGLLLRKPDDQDVSDTDGATSPFREEKTKNPAATVLALVALRNIEEGDPLAADLFEEKPYLKGLLPEGAFLNKADLAGQKMGRFGLVKGQILTLTNLNIRGVQEDSHDLTIVQSGKVEVYQIRAPKKPVPAKTDAPAPAAPRPDGERGEGTGPASDRVTMTLGFK